MSGEPRKFAFESMGTHWAVTVWDAMGSAAFTELERAIIARAREFEALYSRFRTDSLVWDLARSPGVHTVPRELVEMLQLYARLNALSDGKCNPLVGFTLSDLGYDADYTLVPQAQIRATPEFSQTLRILDDERIELAAPALIDLGALGKGYFVDIMVGMLREKGLRRFLSDGSGDVYYEGDGYPLRVGLEDPADPTKAIGVATLLKGSLCGSAGNRRKWGDVHHIIDPDTGRSASGIAAAWVTADTAVLADGLTTCVFLTEPERYREAFGCEYLLMNSERKVKRSEGFEAELF